MDIFKNIKFGDKFITRNNKIAICINPVKFVFAIFDDYTSTEYTFSINKNGYYLSGESNDYDIVIKDDYIDEEKLDKLAEDSINNIKMFCSAPHVFEMATTYENGFKNGYRKAKGE